MLYGVISDIHSNLEAFNAVLDSLENHNVDNILCTGDVVGYGPDPNGCMELISEKVAYCVKGNHDYAALEQLGSEFFNRTARQSCDWTRNQLTPANLSSLQHIPFKQTIPEDNMLLVHSEPWLPQLFDYIQSTYDATLNLSTLDDGCVCFTGHSHVPICFYSDSSFYYYDNETLTLPENAKAIVNVGSVGQPRDGDPRSSYVLYDSTTRQLTFKRVSYDFQETGAKIQRAGLPKVLGDRLRFGR